MTGNVELNAFTLSEEELLEAEGSLQGMPYTKMEMMWSWFPGALNVASGPVETVDIPHKEHPITWMPDDPTTKWRRWYGPAFLMKKKVCTPETAQRLIACMLAAFAEGPFQKTSF